MADLGEVLCMHIRERGEKAAGGDIAAIRRNAALWTGDPKIVDCADELPCSVIDLRVTPPGRS